MIKIQIMKEPTQYDEFIMYSYNSIMVIYNMEELGVDEKSYENNDIKRKDQKAIDEIFKILSKLKLPEDEAEFYKNITKVETDINKIKNIDTVGVIKKDTEYKLELKLYTSSNEYEIFKKLGYKKYKAIKDLEATLGV
jgi:hypothetical protein